MRLVYLLILLCITGTLFAEEMRFGDSKYTNVLEDIKVHSERIDSGGDNTQKVHEGTHYINSYLENTYRGYAWFYVLKNRVFRVRHPKITLTQVAQLVPLDQRTVTYNTYLVQSRTWWDHEPLYILNEWSAYHNGTECAILEDKARAKYSHQCSQELLEYALLMRKILPKDYNSKDLDIFMDWMKKEILRQQSYFK